MAAHLPPAPTPARTLHLRLCALRVQTRNGRPQLILKDGRSVPITGRQLAGLLQEDREMRAG